MLCVSVLLTSSEWGRIQQAAEQFPGEVLSRAEIVRRYTLAGSWRCRLRGVGQIRLRFR